MLQALFPSSGTSRKIVVDSAAAGGVGTMADVSEDAGLIAILCGYPTTVGSHDSHVQAPELLQLYRAHGDDVPKQLAGRFAIAIIDTVQRKILLAVDRLGIEPMAWAQADDGAVLFASTANAVARAVPGKSLISPQAVFDYLYFHVIPSPRTIYERVRKLPPATQVVVTPEGVSEHCYWKPDFNEISEVSEEALETRLMELLRTSVTTMSANGTAGAFLSGGLDSSTVSGILREARAEPAKCFTIGFDRQGFDELEFAQCATRHFDNELIHYYVTPEDVVASVSEIAAAYDEPFGNSSAIPALSCARLARSHGIDLMLAGDGGDELFAGNERYRKQMMFNWYRRLPGPARRVLDGVARLSPGPQATGLSRAFFYLEKAKAELPRRLDFANFVSVKGSNNIFTSRFNSMIDPRLPCANLEALYAAGPGSKLKNMLYLDWKITLADNDLRKVIRMCDLAGIEVRFPFLAPSIVEFAQNLPSNLLMKNMQLRHFFRQAVKDFLPDKILNKTKHGFGMPLGHWLLDHKPLRRIAYESLEGLQQRNIVTEQFVVALKIAHRDEHPHYYGAQLWVFMMLEQWLRAHAPETSF